MPKPSPRKLSPRQLEAVKRFAAQHGRTWKDMLRDCWYQSHYPGMYDADTNDDAAYLQQVRNQFGPSWLVNFKLPKEPR